MNQASPGPVATWRDRAEAVDWDVVRAELDRYGCALTGPLLTPGEAAADRGAVCRRRALQVDHHHEQAPFR